MFKPGYNMRPSDEPVMEGMLKVAESASHIFSFQKFINGLDSIMDASSF